MKPEVGAAIWQRMVDYNRNREDTRLREQVRGERVG